MQRDYEQGINRKIKNKDFLGLKINEDKDYLDLDKIRVIKKDI